MPNSLRAHLNISIAQMIVMGRALSPRERRKTGTDGRSVPHSINPETRKNMNAVKAHNALIRKKQVIKKLLEFFAEGGLSKLSNKERQSQNSIATALIRKGYVTTLKNPQVIQSLLIIIAKRKGIDLPEINKKKQHKKKKETPKKKKKVVNKPKKAK